MADRASASGCHRVMIVDDHPDTRDMFSTILTSQGYAVTAPADAAAAFEALRHEPYPCVVLLDFHMPDGDGWAFIDRMGRDPRCPAVPVVFVSGDLDLRILAEERGLDFLAKPVEIRPLVAAIDRHCRHRHRDRVSWSADTA